MLCKKCGAEIKEGSKFCFNYGSPVSDQSDQGERNSHEDSLQNEGKNKPAEPQLEPQLESQLHAESQSNVKSSSLLGFPWLVLAVFVLQGSFLLKSITLLISKKSLSTIYTPLFSIITYILFILILDIFMRTSDLKKEPFSFKKFFTTLIGSLSSLLIIMGSFSASGLIISKFYTQIISAGLDNVGFGYILLIVYIALILVLQFFVIAGIFLLYITIKYSLSFFKTGKAFGRVMTGMLKRLPSMFLLDILFSIMFIVLYIVQNYGGKFIENMQPYGFLQVFLKYLLLSALFAAILSILFSRAKKLEEGEAAKFQEIAESRGSLIPIVPILFAIILVIAVATAGIPPQNGYSVIVTEIKGHDVRGDILKEAGLIPAAIREYDMSLSALYSLQSYLMQRKAIATKNDALRDEANNLMSSARSLDNLNGYVNFFEGKINLEKEDFKGCVSVIESGLKNPLALQESYIAMLEAASLVEEGSFEEKEKTALNWLLGNEVYHDVYKDLEKASIKKADEWLEDLEELRNQIEPKQVLKYSEYINMRKYDEAVDGALKLKEKYPDNAEINYLLTRIFAEYREEQRYYPELIKAAEDFANSLDCSGNPELLLERDSYLGRMYMLVNEYAKAEKVFANLYQNYPESRDTAETYMYLLVKNGKYDEALKVGDKLEKEGGSPTLIYQYAVCLLNIDKYAESLVKMKEIEKYAEPYSEEYDRYLYVYSLAYANAVKNQEHIDIVENTLGDSILKYYILGMIGWRNKDNDASAVELEKVIQKDERLGYAWYCMGINKYEKAVRTGSGDFDDAIKCYLKCLKILPEYTEGYFAIAHCYKKADMKEEALRAFRKVVELVPFEDHRVDYYGMVVHAYGEISSLSSELAEKEGK